MAATEGLLGAGKGDGNTQNSPLIESLRERRQHPILEMYYHALWLNRSRNKIFSRYVLTSLLPNYESIKTKSKMINYQLYNDCCLR